MIISLVSVIFFGLYAALDAVSNIDFVLQKIGLNEQAASFLGSTRGIYFLFFVSSVALALSIFYQLRKYEDFYHRLESTHNQPIINQPTETVIQTKTEPIKEKPAKKSPPIIDVEPSYLTKFFEEHTTVQANKLAEAYLGKRIKIAGEVLNVNFTEIFAFVYLLYSKDLKVFVYLEDESIIDQARILKRGQKVTMVGEIERISTFEIILNKGEFVDK